MDHITAIVSKEPTPREGVSEGLFNATDIELGIINAIQTTGVVGETGDSTICELERTRAVGKSK